MTNSSVPNVPGVDQASSRSEPLTSSSTTLPPPPPGSGSSSEQGLGRPAAEPETVGAAPRSPWWAWAVASIGVLMLLSIAVAGLLPATLVADKENARLEVIQPAPFAQVPASAESVNERVVFGDLPEGVQRYETDGDLFFVTVSAPAQSVLSWFAGRGDPAISLLTDEDKFGFKTPGERRQANIQSMRTAEQEAQFVALTAAGYDVEISLGEVIVQEVLCRTRAETGECTEEFPSGEFINPFDTIREADGIALNSVEDLSAVLDGKQPGDTADLLIDRPASDGVPGGELSVTVELAASPDDPDRTIIGFRPVDTRVVTLPFEVDIETDQIGGPSAGLAFTLALIDELTEGELTGGHNIAVTGTISLDGSVGPIGGLTQKVSAVRQHGVDTFLVPASQRELGDAELLQRLDDAGHGDVTIIPVSNLDEALAALVDLGGDPLVPVRTPTVES